MTYVLLKDSKINKLKYSAIVHSGTGDKNSGMYIGEPNNPACKENRNILITHKVYDFNDYILKQSNEVYKRRTPMINSDGTIAGYHEPGEFKLKKVLKKYPLNGMDNLSVCWAVASDYPTVSYGMTAWRRDALIIDSDQIYNSLVEAKYTFDYFCTAFDLPKPNYILRNPTSRHIQAGWILNEPFYKNSFSKFNIYIKQLARAYKDYTKCDGDICFNGPACKNPYYSGFETVIVNRKTVDIKSFDKVWNYTPVANKIITSFIPNNTNNTNTNTNTNNTTNVTLKSLVKSTSKSGSKHYFGGETSRDFLECKWLREWVWSEMRNGNTPSENDARKKLQEFAIIAAKQTRKGVHSASELNSKCKCTYNWAVSHFKSSVVKQKAGATFGNFVQRLQSYIVIHLICKIKKNGLSTRKIAEMTGYSIATVSRANEDKINIRDIEIFSAYYKEATEDFKQKYKELYIALKNIIKDIIITPSSYTLYNNTDVTVDENKLQNDLKTIENNSREIDFVEKRLEMFFSKKYTWTEYTENLQKVVNMRPTMSDYQHRYLQRDYSYYRNNLKAV